MTVQEFVKTFTEKKIINTKINEHAVSDYLKEELHIKTYIPFRIKREVVEMVVAQNIKEVDGVKHYDNINSYISFIVAMISTHTILKFSEDPVVDYDLLAENGLLPQIIAEFKASYDECDILLKMAVAAELENNNINVFVGKFLDGILKRMDGFGEIAKEKLGNLNIQELLGVNFKEEDLAKLSSFLDKLK